MGIEIITETRVKYLRTATLNSGDLLEIKLNGNVVDSFTVPQNKTIDAQLTINGKVV